MKNYIIKIPHLKNYIVVVEKQTKKSRLEGSIAHTERMCAEESKIVLPLPIKGKVSAGHLVHEIIHILQYIVEDHSMSFIHEREHLAYIAGYLFEEICNL